MINCYTYLKVILLYVVNILIIRKVAQCTIETINRFVVPTCRDNVLFQ